MFAFCTSALGYSESDAGRRIQAARCIARFPDVYALLESNAVTIAAISRVASLLTADNKDGILSRIQGRTLDEVDAIVAQYRPRAALPRDRVDRVRSLASHRLPANASYQDIFEMLMDEFLERKDPCKRRAKRVLAGERRTASGAGAASIKPR
ncbi:MAG TPA: hypothetical protein VFT13_10035, partial [Candidatus Krumholzibacteria bacterium]|nr:hypothetical protein [Candidatus Krumholzibacteria bacterium]